MRLNCKWKIPQAGRYLLPKYRLGDKNECRILKDAFKSGYLINSDILGDGEARIPCRQEILHFAQQSRHFWPDGNRIPGKETDVDGLSNLNSDCFDFDLFWARKGMKIIFLNFAATHKPTRKEGFDSEKKLLSWRDAKLASPIEIVVSPRLFKRPKWTLLSRFGVKSFCWYLSDDVIRSQSSNLYSFLLSNIFELKEN